MSRDQTCEQRVADQLQSREDDLAEMYALIDTSEEVNPDAYEAGLTRLDEYPLSISEEIVVTILLSWGGPSDSIEVRINKFGPRSFDYEILRATYHFADWFDHAERAVPEDSAMMRYLTDTIESYMESR